MPVDDLDGLIIVDADVVGLDPDDGSQLLVQLVHPLVPVSASHHREEPQVGNLGEEGARDLA